MLIDRIIKKMNTGWEVNYYEEKDEILKNWFRKSISLDLDNISEYLGNHSNLDWDPIRDFPNIAPSWDLIWSEWKARGYYATGVGGEEIPYDLRAKKMGILSLNIDLESGGLYSKKESYIIGSFFRYLSSKPVQQKYLDGFFGLPKIELKKNLILLMSSIGGNEKGKLNQFTPEFLKGEE